MLSESHARSIAAIGLIGLVLLVTATGPTMKLAGVTIDPVILGMPLAILACIPYVRKRGLGSAPGYIFGPATIVFLVVALLSVVANGGRFDAFLTCVRYAVYFLLTLVISVVAQDRGLRRLLLWVIALSCGATTVLAYMQYMNPQLTPGMNGIDASITTRVVGTFYNANFYAEYLLLCAGVLVALFLTEEGRARELVLLIGFSVAGALFLTYTRGSWLGLVIGMLVLIIVVDMRLLVPLAIAAMAGVLLVPGVARRLVASKANDASANFRLGLWQVAGEAIRRKPFFGYGAGDFLGAYRDVILTRPDLYAGYLQFGAHDSYFELAAETGILGGLSFFIVTVIFATRGIYVATRAGIDRETKMLSIGLSVGLVGLVANTFTSNTFQHPQPAVFFWIISGIVAALGAGVWEAAPREVSHAEAAPDSAAAGSLAMRATYATKNALSHLWRGSRTFEATGTPRSADSERLTSSVFLRLLFEPWGGRRGVSGE